MGSTTDGRALRGERSRSAVLDRARRLATVDGLDGLSLARLASDHRLPIERLRLPRHTRG